MEFSTGVPHPALWLLAGTACLSGLLFAKARRRPWRVFWFNAAAILLIFAGFELRFTRFGDADQDWPTNIVRSGYGTLQQPLGYGPHPGGRHHIVKTLDGRIVYDAVFSYDENQARVVPGDVAPGAPVALFFGCSFTVGEALNDDQTYPAVFQRLSQGRVAAYNLGFQGYGPHQMLRRLETGYKLDFLEGRRVERVFYMAISEHGQRSGGLTHWDLYGPRYELDARGEPAFRGPFHGELAGALIKAVDQSAFAGWLHDGWLKVLKSRPSVQERNDRLFVALLKASRDAARAKFHASFHVLLWWKEEDGASDFERRLREAGVDYVPMRDILPGFDQDADRYVIRPRSPGDAGDGHPNAAANELIGRYLQRKYRFGPPSAARS